MKRLGVIDRVLLFTLLPIWAFWFALYLYNLANGRIARLPIEVSAPQSPDNYPIVLGLDVPSGHGSISSWTGLQVGDRLLRIGQADLQGVRPVGFLARQAMATDASLRVRLVFVRAGLRHEVLLPLFLDPFPWVWAIIIISSVGMGLLLLIRKPNSRLMQAFFLATIVFNFWPTPVMAGPPFAPLALIYTWAGLIFVSSFVMFPLIFRAAQLFPEDTVPAGARLSKWPWLFSILGLITAADLFGILAAAALRYAFLIAVLAYGITLLGYLSHKYVHADPVTRRQIKWMLYGLYLAMVPILGVEVLVLAFKPSLWPMLELSWLFNVFIPLCIFISIVRFNLFDIDRLIGATAAYTLVSIVVIAGAITMLPRISRAANHIVGLDPAAGQFMMSLLLAAVVVPGSRYLRPQIERFFFAERYALERGVEHLLREIPTCAGPQEVLVLVGQRLDSYLRPESCVVYGRSGETYAPLFVRGRAVAPTINVYAALITVLQSETRSVEVERWLRRRALALSSSDRAVLDSLGAAVLVPMHRGDIVAAFVCLGQKRSGDIYTATDLTLLTAVAERVSGELTRFDEAEISRQVRVMSDSLRRYVPEQIAAQVVAGLNLEARESEVSILFVDIRGYTTYAEDKSAAEVFSTVNRYTETVSRIVRAHGGTVAEFSGDGMMAVFGAPTPLADKENAAVATAREIALSVRSLELGPAQRQPALEVGVGIATGKAFIGNIQSVDRLIWSAIGDTPNLAARLQGLSRELNAAVVIDAATRSSAGDAAADFKLYEGIPIRGRRQTADVYALPLIAADAPENLQEGAQI